MSEQFEGFEPANTTPAMPSDCWKCNLELHPRLWQKSTNLCWHCHDGLLKKVVNNNKRARVKGNEANLTVAQWAKKLYLSNGFCFYCEKYIGFNGLVLEHSRPIAKGGSTTLSNCVPACGDCNAQRWSQGVEE